MSRYKQMQKALKLVGLFGLVSVTFGACTKTGALSAPSPDDPSIPENRPPGTFDVRIDSLTANSVVLRWDDAKDEDGDSVHYSIELNGKAIVSDLSVNAYKLTGLSETSHYTGEVTATDSKTGTSNSSFSFQTPKFYLRYLKRYNYEYGGYGSGSNVYGVVKANDDGYIVMGRSGRTSSQGSPQLFLMKIDLKGNTLWKKFYHSDTLDDMHTRLATTADGYLATSIYNILKIDNQGAIKWKTRINDFYTGDHRNALSSVKADSDGNVYAVGFRGSVLHGVEQEAVLVKLNSSGNLLYEKTIIDKTSNSKYHNFYDLQIDGSNNLLLFGNVGNQFWIVKTNSEGDELWQKKYTDGIEFPMPQKIIQLKNGDYAFCGALWDMHETYHRFLARIKANGDIVWQKRDETASSIIYGIDEAKDGSIMAIGTFDFIYKTSMAMFNYDINGIVHYLKSYEEGFASFQGKDVVTTQDGGYLLAADKAYLNSGEEAQILCFKTDPYWNFRDLY